MVALSLLAMMILRYLGNKTNLGVAAEALVDLLWEEEVEGCIINHHSSSKCLMGTLTIK